MKYKIVQKDLEKVLELLVRRHEKTPSNIVDFLNEGNWINQDNIQGFSIGLRNRNGEVLKGEWVIQVLVREKLNDLEFENKIPEIIVSPFSGNNIELDVIEIGEFETSSFDYRSRPCLGGFMISRIDGQAGTFGCLVQDFRKDIYLISCSHVLAGHSMHQIGDPIYQNRVSNSKNNVIAILSARSKLEPSTTFSTLMDAAIAKIEPPVKQRVSPRIEKIGNLRGVSPTPRVGTKVGKSGFRSELTTGKVVGKKVHAKIKIRFRDKTFYTGFKNQLIANYNSMSGDSGSIVFNRNYNVVGLHFARSNSGFALFTPITRIFNEFNLRLIGKDDQLS